MSGSAILVAQIVPVASIDVAGGRRSLDPAFVETLAWDIKANGLSMPIELVAAGDRHALVTGHHRFAAVQFLGQSAIPAFVKPIAAFASEQSLRLREISENLIRRQLSALDRAFDVADWRDIYLSTQDVVGRGRPKKQSHDETVFREGWTVDQQEQFNQRFAVSLPRAASEALRVERATLFRDLKIASLGQALRTKISLLPIANNSVELLALARETPARREQVAELMLRTFPVPSVADALRSIDGLPLPTPTAPFEKLSASFSRLKPHQREAFFALHEDLILAWVAARSSGAAL